MTTKRTLLAAAALLLLAAGAAVAQQAFERRVIDNGNWNSGRFADAVTVRTPARFIYLSGQGSEDEATGAIRHPGDAAAQCRYAWEKIKKLLAQQGAGVRDIVKATTYVTDARFQPAMGECRTAALEGAPAVPHTFLVVAGLAWPGMLMEVDVVAAVAP
ncbi:RidA family protein [Roseomonas populi]|uniref:RidA family protein n=1 Tax=Roseomonas populi TaxID=3121582 RepID=A0ABT1X5D1_9PROT|nr:RidA family protein [Roseomonas pecuniae]MCR0983310.1 RidA family protein [Roseomonas pecuniae]